MNPRSGEEEEPQRSFSPRMQQTYKFTSEELRVLRDCNKDSFYQRCLPFSALLGVGTYYGVKTGYLGPSSRFGAIPKVTVAVIVGYFLGKFSYQSKCAEKLMQLPNSQIGEMLRKRRKGTWQESLDPTFGPGMSLAPFSGINSSEVYSDLEPRGSSLDMDTSRPQYEGLDESRRPSIDNPVYEEEEEMPPVQKHTTSYDELRKKNRDEYQQRRTSNYPEAPRSPMTRPEPPPGPASPTNPPTVGPRNKYGDVWE